MTRDQFDACTNAGIYIEGGCGGFLNRKRAHSGHRHERCGNAPRIYLSSVTSIHPDSTCLSLEQRRDDLDPSTILPHPSRRASN